jgi:hypothetical protein
MHNARHNAQNAPAENQSLCGTIPSASIGWCKTASKREEFRLGPASTVQKALQFDSKDILDRYKDVYFVLDPLFPYGFGRRSREAFTPFGVMPNGVSTNAILFADFSGAAIPTLNIYGDVDMKQGYRKVVGVALNVRAN